MAPRDNPHQHRAGVLLDEDLVLAFDLAPVGLCVSRERVIQRCNAAFAEMFGYPGADLEGRSLECLYPRTATSRTSVRWGCR